jgi:hypothetical protein
MNIIRGVTRVVTETANATTAAAGALGGAAVNGVIGGLQGTAAGIRDGLSSGSRSTPAALLTVGAVGAVGLVEWPVLLTVGGAALLVRQLAQRGRDRATDRGPAEVTPISSAPTAGTGSPGRTATRPAPRKAAQRKPARSRAPRST